MVSKDDNSYVIWPLYFDKSLSRNQGRKVPRKLAVEKPQLESVLKAARSLGLNPINEKTKSHPSQPSMKNGRILVEKKSSKANTIKQIANRL
jgi:signal recognition particle subunit SRP19